MLTGERIRNTREDMDILQQELADAIKINVSVLSRIEKGTRQIRDDELVKIADKLHVTTDYLLGRTDDARPLEALFAPPAVPAATPSLTPQEQDLLRKNRQLTPAGRSQLDTYLDFLLSQESASAVKRKTAT